MADDDALSLHTIAEDADMYAAQEQAPEVPVQSFMPYRDEPDSVAADPLVPYRDDPHAPPSDEPQSPAVPSRQEGRIFKILQGVGKVWAYLGLATSVLVIIVIIVLLLVAFLVGKGKHYNGPKDRFWKVSGSSDYRLELAKLYPPLEDGASEHCQKTWEKSASAMRCHRMILSAAWDNGDPVEIEREYANPYAYQSLICQSQCKRSIESLRIYYACSRRTDRFNMTDYSGYLDRDKVEEGPVHVYQRLLARYDRFCAKPPTKSASEWGTCAADMWMRWGVADGFRQDNMNSLKQFVQATAEKKVLPAKTRRGTITLADGTKETYKVAVPERRVGPGLGDTDCGFCTLDWLERKMRSFEYGQMLDPMDKSPISLPAFDKQLQHALARCGLNGSNTVIGRVHDRWRQLGLWCNTTPCYPNFPIPHESTYSILHGLDANDALLRSLRDWIGRQRKGSVVGRALQVLHDAFLAMPCSPWMSVKTHLTQYVIPSQNVISHLCSDECRNPIDRLQAQHGALLTQAQGESKWTNGESEAGIFWAWDQSREVLEQVCKRTNPRDVVRQWTSFCAPGYAALHRAEWIFAKEPPPKSEVLSAFAERIDAFFDWDEKYGGKKDKEEGWEDWRPRQLAQSACNTCAGELLVGHHLDWKDRVDEFLDDDDIDGHEYVRVAKKYIRFCWEASGREYSEQIWQMYWEKMGLNRYD
ncbi:hypothetical protein EJ04DRAFT_576650 [Polyplosphaeria fusca]|uniref:Uncharacterized protein n=1 Tax=Polyplosphaeria fusca TaxID=682080 RepID=A0A9P4V348_9PLEO|nr:hypothetical protein EJ04DRAFT_576650 [Polyplosphaeria fusca]